MNVMAGHEPEDLAATEHDGKVTLRKDANNFYVSSLDLESYYFDFDYGADKNDGFKLTNLTYNPVVLSAQFIPACAGNTEEMKKTRQATSVHPRVCGEHSSWTQLELLDFFTA